MSEDAYLNKLRKKTIISFRITPPVMKGKKNKKNVNINKKEDSGQEQKKVPKIERLLQISTQTLSSFPALPFFLATVVPEMGFIPSSPSMSE